MSADWRSETIGDLIARGHAHLQTGPFGTALKAAEYTQIGVPLISVREIREGYLSITGETPKVSKETTSRLPKFVLKQGDIVFGRKGGVDRNSIISKPENGWFLGSDGIRLRLGQGYDPYYFSYLMRSSHTKAWLLQNCEGTTMPSLNQKVLGRLPITYPDLKSQQQIGRVLLTFDQKQQLNHQINQTLEQMAQAIFKSWFVDFEPVKAKIAALEAGGSEEDAQLATMRVIAGDAQGCANAAGGTTPGAAKGDTLNRLQSEQPEQYAELRATAELFPSSMQDSELGEIPEGWSVSDFGAVSKCFDKHRIPLSKRQREQRQGHIPYYGATSVMDYVDEPIFDGIYLLLGEDGSVLREDGSPFTQYIWGKSWINNHAHVLQGANGVSTEQLCLFIGMQNITAYVTGAVQLKLNQKNMNSIPFIKAPEELNTRFSRLIAPMFGLRRKLTEENDSLKGIRDALLPRHLSGELSVSSAEDRLAEKAVPANV